MSSRARFDALLCHRFHDKKKKKPKPFISADSCEENLEQMQRLSERIRPGNIAVQMSSQRMGSGRALGYYIEKHPDLCEAAY